MSLFANSFTTVDSSLKLLPLRVIETSLGEYLQCIQPIAKMFKSC